MRAYTPAERCMLLLFAQLEGDAPLSPRAYHGMARMLETLGQSGAPQGELDLKELRRLGQTSEDAAAILRRLDREALLSRHLDTLDRLGLTVLTRISPEYPRRLRKVLGDQAPMLLYCAGALPLLNKPCVSLVGSRALRAPGRRFAAAAGRAMARQGMTYASGGAAGADTVGFRGALDAGGGAVVFLADSLRQRAASPELGLDSGRVVLVSLEGFDLPFSVPRAYARNRLIHAIGQIVLVAQSDYGSGGTWQGVTENLRHGWSPVFVFDPGDEDPGARGLIERGATAVRLEELQDLGALRPSQLGLF